MSLSKFATLLLGAAGSVAAHGYVTSIDVDGTTYGGYLINSYYYESDPPEVIAWSTTATDTGYVSPTAYEDSDIICHRGAEPGALSAEIAPGGSVTLYWSTWPDDHHGPVITYLANCNGDCASVDKTILEFFKIDAGGLVDNSNVPGTWATDELISANYSRTVTIPSDIASGNYVLRHEIIALHGAGTLDAAQNYPQCVNLKVTGSGTATPSGTLGTALYKDTDPGIYVNIWQSIESYTIPGPALYTAGSTAPATTSKPTTSSTTTGATTISTTTTTTTAVATSTTTTTDAAAAPTATITSTTSAGDNAPTQLPPTTSATQPTSEQPSHLPENDQPTGTPSCPTSPEPSGTIPQPTASQEPIPTTTIPDPEASTAPSSGSGPDSSSFPSAPTGSAGEGHHHFGAPGHHGKGKGRKRQGKNQQQESRSLGLLTERKHARDLSV